VSPLSLQWFPVWVERYAGYLGQSQATRLDVNYDLVVGYLRSLRDLHVPAWQRLQAARALECYRDVVQCVATPNLAGVLRKLAEIAEHEQARSVESVGVESRGALPEGMIDPDEPAVIRQLRRECRLRHYSLRTEKAYAGAGSGCLTRGLPNTQTPIASSGGSICFQLRNSRVIPGLGQRAGIICTRVYQR
jgi:hypothetical protein